MATQKLESAQLKEVRNQFEDRNERRSHSYSIEEMEKRFPKHVFDIGKICAVNASIRRYTSLGVIAALEEEGVLSTERKHYCRIMFNKFVITDNGLKTEYPLTHPAFLKALCAAFECFAKESTLAINTYVNKTNNESLKDIVSDEDISHFVELINSKQPE